MNPHFLFNTLNSLSSLIADDPERAGAFVDEMAKVYRYLLQTNQNTIDPDGELITLMIELTFIESYFHLLKTRYGAGITLDIAVDKADQGRLLPPLTLQMLVENAVKHIVIHANKPLLIEIKSAPGGYLLVRNNRKANTTPKNRSPVLRTKVGLTNIRAKYRLLNGPPADPADGLTSHLVVNETYTHFAVYLPLLNQTRHERINC